MPKNVVIIGGGPAGASAALYTARAGIDTIIIENGVRALEKAEKIENYYGFENGISGKELYSSGLIQAKNVGAKVVTAEVVGLSFEDKFKVLTTSGEYCADSVIIATGASRNKPKIENLEKFEGSGISYCAVCDGFFFRSRDVAVLGSGEYAAHEASVLLPFASSVTLLTDGEEISATIPDGVKINASKMPWTGCRAVCFTECPWSSLIDHTEKYSSYGIGFEKSFIFTIATLHYVLFLYFVRNSHP